MTRSLLALVAAFILSGSAFAQEFGRVSGGELEVAAKSSSTLSGSLGMELPFLSGRSGQGYGATLGGTIIRDRVWFFASMQQSETPVYSGPASSERLDTKVIGDIGSRQNLSASFSRANFAATPGANLTVPSSFLSLRYTGIVSSNMFFTATISRGSTSRPALLPVE